MRLIKSLTFISLMAVVLAETPTNILVRRPLLSRPLIKLAVQPPVLNAPVAVADVAAVEQLPVAPVASILPVGRRMMPYPQYWPGYGAENWFNYQPQPYWGGGYGQMGPRGYRFRPRRRFWRSRVAMPVEPTTPAPVTDNEPVEEVAVDSEAAVEPAVMQPAVMEPALLKAAVEV